MIDDLKRQLGIGQGSMADKEAEYVLTEAKETTYWGRPRTDWQATTPALLRVCAEE